LVWLLLAELLAELPLVFFTESALCTLVALLLVAVAASGTSGIWR
jgi:hypothetical protein